MALFVCMCGDSTHLLSLPKVTLSAAGFKSGMIAAVALLHGRMPIISSILMSTCSAFHADVCGADPKPLRYARGDSMTGCSP